MKNFKWQLAAGAALVATSALLYLAHYAIFGDYYHIFIYFLTDIAFLPLEVLIVTVIIEKFLSVREAKERLEKLNMVIGVFFSEMGTHLLVRFSSHDRNIEQIRKELVLNPHGTDEEFHAVARRIMTYEYDVDISMSDLKGLKAFLAAKRDFMVRMLENPSLLEHESFTDLLFAVFHLVEELEHRDDLMRLPDPDVMHLRGDSKRAYAALMKEWLTYMKHLKGSYPYLFSLAIRTNPFDKDARAEVRE